MSRLASIYTISGLLSTISGLGVRHTGLAGLLGALLSISVLYWRRQLSEYGLLLRRRGASKHRLLYRHDLDHIPSIREEARPSDGC